MYKMEKLYSKEDLIFDGINCERKIPYKIFSTITRDKKMDKYSTQFYALNDYAYFITKSINDKKETIDNRMKELLEWIQNDNVEPEELDDGTYSDVDDLVDLYFGEEEDKNYWMPVTEQISINTIIMCLLSFCEGTIKEIILDFINKIKIEDNINIVGIDSCIKKLQIYDKNNLIKDIEKDISVIKKAKRIRNKFVHEQWMTIKNNVWDFKTRKDLNKISIIDLINSITNLLEVVEQIGIDNGVYEIK